MRQRSIPVVLRSAHRAPGEPFSVWLCAVVILGVSAGFYYLLFRLVSALALW